MGISCGVVGLPNVGKSTLFNALTNSNIAAENFPFCTIEPNTGVVRVNDYRLDKIAEIIKPQNILHSNMVFIDIAGLIRGASKGEGKGNAFLSNIRECDAIVHVVRCFEDENVIHVEDKIDPQADIETINLELALADLEIVDKAIIKLERTAKAGDKASIILVAILKKCKLALDEGKALRTITLDEEEKLLIKSYNFITIKPMLYLANVSEDSVENKYVEVVKSIAKAEGSQSISMCNKYEADLVGLSAEEKKEFLAEIGQNETGLDRFIKQSYELLGLASYFTAGVKEVRSWTFHKGSTAPKAAGVIHTDFERGFISADVVFWEDFVSMGGWSASKEKGAVRMEGKNYVVRDGDVMMFKFNV